MAQVIREQVYKITVYKRCEWGCGLNRTDVKCQRPALSWGALWLTGRGQQSSLSLAIFTVHKGGPVAQPLVFVHKSCVIFKAIKHKEKIYGVL